MSDNFMFNPTPMEVEESHEEYMASFERMLEKVDNPNEVNGTGVSADAGDVPTEGGGLKGMEGSKVAKPSPYPLQWIQSKPVLSRSLMGNLKG